MKRLNLIGLALLALFFADTAMANCRADVEVGRFWVERNGFSQKANLKVRVKNARPDAGVRVYVDARFHYERTDDGWSNTESAKDDIYIDTSETSSGSMVVEAVASLCGNDHPCRINDVEITDVSCYD
jgi:hypothetical protein